MQPKHHSQKYVPANIYNKKVHLGFDRGSGESKKSKRKVVLEYTMECKAFHFLLQSSTAKISGSFHIV